VGRKFRSFRSFFAILGDHKIKFLAKFLILLDDDNFDKQDKIKRFQNVIEPIPEKIVLTNREIPAKIFTDTER
jgi:hypothetical protein